MRIAEILKPEAAIVNIAAKGRQEVINRLLDAARRVWGLDKKLAARDIAVHERSYLVRMQEMRQSLRIVQQAAANLPAGPVKTADRKVALPPRAELDRSMESLIHHFKLMTEGFHVPPMEIYSTIEASKGEHGYFIISDGSAKPYRLHVRGPSFVHLQSLDTMARGAMAAMKVAITTEKSTWVM